MDARITRAIAATLTTAALGVMHAQQAGPAPAAGTYWVEKTRGGVYLPPNTPIVHLADLKARHAGDAVWKELVVKDPEIQAEYNGAVPGTRISPRFHPDTGNFLVVISGEMHVDIEGQPPVTAVRGSIVNIMKSTVFSVTVAGTEPALWVDVNPVNFKTLYPGSEPRPAATNPGADVIQVSFARTPGPYAAPNLPHWNLFDAARTGCQAGIRVLNDHLYANPLYGFADPADPLNRATPCASGDGGRAGGGRNAAPGTSGATVPDGQARVRASDAAAAFGHLHAGPAEWWIVQVGQISGRFENIGDVLGVEGDVLYAAPMTWHQMSFHGPGPSCRLALGAYPMINMNSIPNR